MKATNRALIFAYVAVFAAVGGCASGDFKGEGEAQETPCATSGTPTNGPFDISISPMDKAVSSGDQVVTSVTLTNTSAERVMVASNTGGKIDAILVDANGCPLTVTKDEMNVEVPPSTGISRPAIGMRPIEPQGTVTVEAVLVVARDAAQSDSVPDGNYEMRLRLRYGVSGDSSSLQTVLSDSFIRVDVTSS
jgi:hypothetical protein